MLFTWDTTNLCIIFPQWHVHSTFSLLMSLIGVIVLTAGYEFVREMSRRYEASSTEYANKLPSKFSHPSPDPSMASESNRWARDVLDVQQAKTVLTKTMTRMYANEAHYCGRQGRVWEKWRKDRSWSRRHFTLYKSFTVFSSCELSLLCKGVSGRWANPRRLLFMTYNGWVMLSVAVGAFVGYLAFGNSGSTKSVACH